MYYLEKIGKNSKKAFKNLKKVNHSKIRKILDDYNIALLKNKNKIIYENNKDIKGAKRKQLIDRLILNDERIENIRYSINQISKFKNPIGVVLDR